MKMIIKRIKEGMPNFPSPDEVWTWMPSCNSLTGSMVTRWDDDEATITVKDGTVISVRAGGFHATNYAYDSSYEEVGQTIIEALVDAGYSQRDVQSICVRVHGRDWTEGRQYEDWDGEVVYVPDEWEEETVESVIAEAAKLLAAQKISFREFSRIVRENLIK